MQGTSQATSVAAAAAVLTREFYFRGWYGFPPPAVQNISLGFNPPASLIKATLINGARHIDGVVLLDGYLSTINNLPSNVYRGANFWDGFGVPTLGKHPG